MTALDVVKGSGQGKKQKSLPTQVDGFASASAPCRALPRDSQITATPNH